MESVITAEKRSQLVPMGTPWRDLSHFGFQMCGLCRNTDTHGAGLTERASWPGKGSCEPLLNFLPRLARCLPCVQPEVLSRTERNGGGLGRIC